MFAEPPSADALPPGPMSRPAVIVQADAAVAAFAPLAAPDPAVPGSAVPLAWRSEAFYEDLPDMGSRPLPVARADWPAAGAAPAAGSAPGAGWLTAGAVALTAGGALAAALGGEALSALHALLGGSGLG